jgi:hypothetical protein
MVTGKPPLSHMSPQRALAFLGVQKCLPLDTPTTTLPGSLPDALQQLLCACLLPEPEGRPTAAEALQVCAGRQCHAMGLPRQHVVWSIN